MRGTGGGPRMPTYDDMVAQIISANPGIRAGIRPGGISLKYVDMLAMIFITYQILHSLLVNTKKLMAGTQPQKYTLMSQVNHLQKHNKVSCF